MAVKFYAWLHRSVPLSSMWGQVFAHIWGFVYSQMVLEQNHLQTRGTPVLHQWRNMRNLRINLITSELFTTVWYLSEFYNVYKFDNIFGSAKKEKHTHYKICTNAGLAIDFFHNSHWGFSSHSATKHRFSISRRHTSLPLKKGFKSYLLKFLVKISSAL